MSEPTLFSRLRGAFLGFAVSDALGGPVEFQTRDSFPKVTSMLPNDNFRLPAGCFTDDTSMALCLASSLLENGGRTNALDQVRKYIAWHSTGYMSSTGKCFDIGISTSKALQDWSKYLKQEHDHLRPDSEEAIGALARIEQKIDKAYDKESCCGNGGLMRVLPVSLIARNEEDAVSLAAASSKVTHPHARCVDAAKIYAILVHRALEGTSKEGLVSSISDLVQSGDGFRVEGVLRDRFVPYKDLSSWHTKPVWSIRSTGYVVDSLEASLWAFFTTDSFEEGAIKAVNLGDDADTVGAIYGGLAGAFYGFESIPALWLSAMKSMAMLDDIVEQIIEFRKNVVFSGVGENPERIQDLGN